MKKFFRLSCLTALIVLVVSCSGEDRFYNFKMDRVNLNGANYLALAGGQSNTKDGVGSQQYLYSVDENGNLTVVAYEYQCDDNGVATELSRKLTLTVNQMVPVGDKYIWLVGCRYECDDYSSFSESMQDAIRDMVNHSKQNFGENFLIRKSDGKIFDLNEVIVKFPIVSIYVPGLGNMGVVGYGGDNGLPVDGDLTGDRLRKLGLINQLGDDIYLASGSYYGFLTRLHDNGSSISVYNVLDYNIGYSVTDNQGHLGTTICYTGNSPDVASIMAPNGTLPAIQGIPDNDYRPEMRCIGILRPPTASTLLTSARRRLPPQLWPRAISPATSTRPPRRRSMSATRKTILGLAGRRSLPSTRTPTSLPRALCPPDGPSTACSTPKAIAMSRISMSASRASPSTISPPSRQKRLRATARRCLPSTSRLVATTMEA